MVITLHFLLDYGLEVVTQKKYFFPEGCSFFTLNENCTLQTWTSRKRNRKEKRKQKQERERKRDSLPKYAQPRLFTHATTILKGWRHNTDKLLLRHRNNGCFIWGEKRSE